MHLDDEDRAASIDSVIRFRHFQVRPSGRMLFCHGQPVDIGSRAFDLLMILLRSKGRLVTKREIFRHVWPASIVGESNLRFQMACLRRVLGHDRDVIKTISGRGYLFTADVVADIDSLRVLPAEAPDAPVISPQPTSPNSVRDAAANETGEDPKPTVVLIEDDRNVRDALEGLFLSSGLRVETFSSIQTFLEQERHEPPHCLVLDVWLPGKTGLDFQADLVKAGMHTPVIFISGDADVPMSVRAMKAGAVEFLVKPVRHQELLRAVQLAIVSVDR